MTTKEYVERYLGYMASFENAFGIVNGRICGYQNCLVCLEDNGEIRNNNDYYQGEYGVHLMLPNLTGKIWVSSINRLTLLTDRAGAPYYPHKCPLCGSPAFVRNLNSFDCSEGC